MKDRLVSVIIPTYNRADIIMKSINSVLRQTYSNIELIIVDDGSTDNTDKIVEEIKDSRVKYIKLQDNLGVSYARNIGIENAIGEFIAFNDSDDCWGENKLEQQMVVFETDANVDMVFCQMRIHGDVSFLYPAEKKLDPNLFEKGMFEILLGSNKVGTPTIVIKKEIVDLIGGFEIELSTKEDWVFALKIAENHKIEYIGEPLVEVWPSDSGVNKITGLKAIKTDIFILGRYWNKFENKKMFDSIMLRLNSEMRSINDENSDIVYKNLREIDATLCDYIGNVSISIIIPIYNSEKHLSECLDSVLNVGIKDAEILCVNDGSTDNSLKIIEEYAKKDDRLRIIDKANSGYGSSLNEAISIAKGEYIFILESDDKLVPGAIQKLYTIAQDTKVDFVKGNYYIYNENNPQGSYFENLRNHPYGCVIYPDDYLYFVAPSLWSALYRKEFLISNSIVFLNTPGAAYQDTSFSFKVWAAAKQIYLLNEPIVFYRDDTIDSSSNAVDNVFAICKEFEEIHNYVEAKKNDKLCYLYEKVKYISYKWNIQRLSISDKIKFLYRARYEFLNEHLQGWFNKVYWADIEWFDVHRIIFDFESYCDEMKLGMDYHSAWEQSNIRVYNMLRCVEKICVCGECYTDVCRFLEERETINYRYCSIDNLQSIARDELVIFSARDVQKEYIINTLEKKNYINYIEI